MGNKNSNQNQNKAAVVEPEVEAVVEPEVEAVVEPEVEAVVEPEELAPFTVAAGKSITSKKGMLKSGDEVKVEFLGGGEDSLKRLISRGIVDKN